MNARQRADLWSREATVAYLNGRGRLPICNLCDTPMQIGQAWEVSHRPGKAKSFGGRDVGVAHARCNREHGAKVVTPALAKAHRVRARHIGASGPGLGKRPMRGGRRSGESKSFRHGVIRRLSAAQKHQRCMAKRAIGATS